MNPRPPSKRVVNNKAVTKMPDDHNKSMSWQMEQLKALRLVRHHLSVTDMPDALNRMRDSVAEYRKYRKDLDIFLNCYFSHICNQSCYTNKRSACCGKDSIITFFAEVVVNAMISDEETLIRLEDVLKKPNIGHKCVYLGDEGCLWDIRPVMCALFLCDQAEKAVFEADPSLQAIWAKLTMKAKAFKWPDRVVLFDEIENIFISAGYQSTLMYCHNSPGLLRIKQISGKKSTQV